MKNVKIMKNMQLSRKEKRLPKILFGSIAVLLLLSVSCGIAFAAPPATTGETMSPPTLPVQIYGTILDMDGKPLPAGTTLTADVNGLRSTFVLTNAGKIGGNGKFDDKFLIFGAGEGDKIVFGIDGTPASTTRIYYSNDASQTKQFNLEIDPAGIIIKSETENTVAIANAARSIDVCYEVSSSILNKQKVPTITRNGRSLVLDENVVVTKIVDGAEINVPVTIRSDGTINVEAGAISDANVVNVSFNGRKIGDVSGDGSPNTLDAAMILKASAEIEALDVKGDFYGDVTNDGQTTTLDAARILQHSADMTDDDYELIN